MQQHGGGGSAKSEPMAKPKNIMCPGGKPPLITSKFWALFDVN